MQLKHFISERPYIYIYIYLLCISTSIIGVINLVLSFPQNSTQSLFNFFILFFVGKIFNALMVSVFI